MKMQIRRVGFKKQVNQALLIPNKDLIVATIEEPNFGFLDP
jgi:hypothetical protein